MAFKNFIYSTTEAALTKAIAAKTVTDDDIAFVNENGVMFIQVKGIKFPCGYSKAEADARYLKLTGGTLTGDLNIQDKDDEFTNINFVNSSGKTFSYLNCDTVQLYSQSGAIEHAHLMIDEVQVRCSWGYTDKYWTGSYGPGTIYLSERDTKNKTDAYLFGFSTDEGIRASSGYNQNSIAISQEEGIRWGVQDATYSDSWYTTLNRSDRGEKKAMTEKCFGPSTLVTNNGIDGGLAGHSDDKDYASNNNTPRYGFQISHDGYYIKHRSGSGSSAQFVTSGYHDQYGAVVGCDKDPATSSVVFSDYGFGFFAEYPEDSSFCGLTPTGVKLYGGSSSKVVVSDGTMSELKTVNGTSLLGSGNIAVPTQRIRFFNAVSSGITVSTSFPSSALKAVITGVSYDTAKNKFIASANFTNITSQTVGSGNYYIVNGTLGVSTSIGSSYTVADSYPQNSTPEYNVIYASVPSLLVTGTGKMYYYTGSTLTAFS